MGGPAGPIVEFVGWFGDGLRRCACLLGGFDETIRESAGQLLSHFRGHQTGCELIAARKLRRRACFEKIVGLWLVLP